MKIALVGPTHPFRGGISHYTTLLYRALRRRHPDTQLYAFSRQYPQWLFPGRSDRDPSAQGLQAEGAIPCLDGCDPSTFLRLGLRLRRDPPDLLILPWWVIFWAPHYQALLGALPRGRRRPKVLFLVHNVHEHEDHWLKQQATRWLLRQGDGFIVHTREDEARLTALLGAKRLRSRPVIRAFHPTYEAMASGDNTAASRAEARQRLRDLDPDLGPETPLILFFGFVRPYKGLDDLVEALALAATEARLWVIGEFWREGRAEFEARVRALGLSARVQIVDRYVGNEEIPPLFQAADVVALPYRSGTGSGVLQLAFGHRRPVIATAVGSQADAVRHGETGLLVPPSDPGALAGAIDRFFDPAQAVDYAAQIDRDVADRFSWQALADAITDHPALR